MKKTTYALILTRLYKFLHFCTASFIFAASWQLFLLINELSLAYRYNFFITCMFCVILLFLTRTYDAYLFEYFNHRDVMFSQTISTTMSIAAVFVLTCAAWNKFYNPLGLISGIAVECVLNIVWSTLSEKVFTSLRDPLKTILIYRTKADLVRAMESKKFGRLFEICSQIHDPKSFDDFSAEIDKSDAVFIAGIDEKLRNAILKYCLMEKKKCFVLPHVGDIILMGGSHISAFSIPLMGRIPSEPNFEFLIVKRFFDIVLSLIAIVITLPVLGAVSVAVKLCDGGPVFYRQTRLTKNGKPFKMLKFRSMIVDAEKDGVARLSSGDNDSRITPVGRFLRSTRLDELPQLFNILKGEMSFVGPRPERPEIASEYEKAIPEFALRLGAKAGLTGYAQVYGKYNTNPYDKLEMDLIYMNKMSFFLDLRLLLATFRILFIKESTAGISGDSTNAMNSNQDF